MKNSGLRKPIYLIEFYKTQDNEKIKEDTLLQAVMNTQVLYTLMQTIADTTINSEISMEGIDTHIKTSCSCGTYSV